MYMYMQAMNIQYTYEQKKTNYRGYQRESALTPS